MLILLTPIIPLTLTIIALATMASANHYTYQIHKHTPYQTTSTKTTRNSSSLRAQSVTDKNTLSVTAAHGALLHDQT